MFRSFRSWHYVLISVVVAINALVVVVAHWVMTLR